VTALHSIFFFIRALLAVVCATAAIGKASGREQLGVFADSLRNIGPQLFATRLRRQAGATIVVAAEAAACILLVLPATSLAGLALAFALLLAFGAAIANVVRRGATAPCHCFGAEGSPLSSSHLLRNGLLAVIAAAGIAVRLSSGPVSALPDYDGALAVALGLLLGIGITRWDDLVFIATPPRPLP
jgi:Methylamine utilisation protein MauE